MGRLALWSWTSLAIGLGSMAIVVPAGRGAEYGTVASHPDCDAMVERIDALVAERWRAENIEPAARTDDSEFLRRAYLDLTGVIPRVSEVRAFLEDQRADKRERLVESLLASPRYATHMATTWRNRLLPQEAQANQRSHVLGVQKWLRDHFAKNTRLDGMIADLIVATDGNELGPALYFLSHDLAPEKLAASTAELFLGMRLHCAQCHDHPYDDWTQKDFWGYAAFFARVRKRDSSARGSSYRLVDARTGDVRLPDTTEVVAPKYLGGRLADESEGGTRRLQLAIWMASRDNSYLPRASANWAWAHLFGHGLVEPVGDAGDHNPPSHPQLLDELARYFARSQFDLRELWRTLTRTRAYHLSSRPVGASAAPPSLFAQMNIKVLTPEQFYDSAIRGAPNLAHSAGAVSARRGMMSTVLDPRRTEFVRRMRFPAESPMEFSAGLPQALMLMNGEVVGDATTPTENPLLGALDAPFLSGEDRVDALFLATLSRYPSTAERQRCEKYLNESGDQSSARQARSDLMWALLNTTEFVFNH